MSTTTPQLGLVKPDLGEDPWGLPVNGNFDLLDGLAGVVLAGEESELVLYLDPATVTDAPQSAVLAAGFAATPMPAGVVTRLLSKWKVPAKCDLTQQIQIVLRYALTGGNGQTIGFQAKTTPIAFAAPMSGGVTTTTAMPSPAPAADTAVDVIASLLLPNNADMVSIQIERIADLQIGTAQLLGAWLRWKRKKQ